MSDDSNNIYRSYQIQAAEAVLDPNESAYYRRICRWYSEKFHTPLIQVESLPHDHVLINYYESILESIPYNDLYDQVKEDFLPDLVEQDDQDSEQFAKDLEAEQAMTLAKSEANRLKANNRLPQDIPQKQQSLSQEDQPSKPGDVLLNFDDPKEP